MTTLLIRTFCWHDWERWSRPYTHTPGGSWATDENNEIEWLSVRNMSQKRTCKKCAKVSYRKCR